MFIQSGDLMALERGEISGRLLLVGLWRLCHDHLEIIHFSANLESPTQRQLGIPNRSCVVIENECKQRVCFLKSLAKGRAQRAQKDQRLIKQGYLHYYPNTPPLILRKLSHILVLFPWLVEFQSMK
jgi:hypothetical protein